MEPIVYRKAHVLNWRDWVFSVSLGWLIIAVGWLILAVLSYFYHPAELQNWADRVRDVLVPGYFVAAAVFFRMALPRHNQLQLDKDGLTYKRAGQRSAWPWRAAGPCARRSSSWTNPARASTPWRRDA